jgi:CRP/FNR family cyclic AMP-dependent transcriptional regulator
VTSALHVPKRLAVREDLPKMEQMAQKQKKKPPASPQSSLVETGEGKTIAAFDVNSVIFAQGNPADAVFNIQKGKIKLTVVSNAGKEAVIAMLGPGDFFGEGCLAGQQMRMSTATAMTECSIARLEKAAVIEMLQKDPAFSKMLLSYMLTRTIRIEEDLIDQLFNSSEKRLARALLLLANFGKEGKPETVIPKISQEVLADMIGTTRSRVSFFMNKFRRLGFIEYNGTLEVHSSLLNVVLHD